RGTCRSPNTGRVLTSGNCVLTKREPARPETTAGSTTGCSGTGAAGSGGASGSAGEPASIACACSCLRRIDSPTATPVIPANVSTAEFPTLFAEILFLKGAATLVSSNITIAASNPMTTTVAHDAFRLLIPAMTPTQKLMGVLSSKTDQSCFLITSSSGLSAATISVALVRGK